MDQYSYIANAHGTYIDELYQAYKKDPDSVDETWKRFFEGFDFNMQQYGTDGASMAEGAVSSDKIKKEIAVRNLIDGYRSRAHLVSDTNPVRQRKDRKARLSLSDYNLTEADLDTVFEASADLGIGAAPLKKIIDRLQKIYCGTIGFEIQSIREPEVLDWFYQKVEHEYPKHQFSVDEKKHILKKLNEAVVFENFLHTRYVGQKRFSLEGGESAIPALDEVINSGSELGAEEVIIGMAHRGRLNILTNTVGKTYKEVFNEFEGNAHPDEDIGDGDVKYHMGFSSQVQAQKGKTVTVNLLPNPSHLEAVNPVVQGNARAKLDTIYDKKNTSVIPVLIHGDGAIAAQGIVYEVVQMSELAGYSVGGTIHFVINNQVSFTTDFDDARSSIYSTDIGQILEAPVIHVNGDDPEAVVFAMRLAVEFRQKFQRDIFVDMVCYRRHGHNESDEPKFTQPKLYNIIAKHPNPREIYSKKLQEAGKVDAELAETMDKEFRQMLDDRLNEVRQNPLPYQVQKFEEAWKKLRRSEPADFEQSPETGITAEAVEKISAALLTLPEDFKPIRQIERLLKNRQKMFKEDQRLDWAAAEMLAYGSVVLDNNIVRVSGQDVERGTFSHRHAVMRDAETNERYTQLNHIEGSQERFMIYNSLLSEYGVLGFEFGYTIANPEALVIWEAQFGDFANGAQTMIDQFISSSESKWQRMSGLVMLLPHGYEGQGPEHSNARPERFLQLCAEYNMVVANITEPSNFFHLLRRQLAWEFRKPCVVMSPKSLLRHPKVNSPIEEFTSGRFREILPDTNISDNSKVQKVLMCSGKVYYDLLDYQQNNKVDDIAIVRVEQLHPFPENQLEAELERYPNRQKLVWVQEEPMNMGYYTYMMRAFYKHPEMEVVARKPSASPATGYAKVHAAEQERVVNAAFSR